jgi:hypothetical protein
MLIVVPLTDITLRSLVAEAGSLQWRFGTVGLLFGNLGTVILGLGIAGLAATLSGSRGILRTVGFVALALAVVMLALMALFALDALQMRRLVQIGARRQVLVSSAGALGSAAVGSVVLLLLGRAALVSSRAARAVAERRGKPAATPLVAAAPAARASEPV